MVVKMVRHTHILKSSIFLKLFFLLLITTYSYADIVENFLKTATKDSQYQLLVKQYQQKTISENNSYIDELELRSNTNEKNEKDGSVTNENEFNLRIRPKSWFEISYTNKIHNRSKTIFNIEKKLLLSQIVSNRYKLLINRKFYIQIIAKLKNILTLYKRKDDSLNKLSSLPNFNIGLFVKNRQKIIEYQKKLNEVILKNNNTKQMIQNIANIEYIDIAKLKFLKINNKLFEDIKKLKQTKNNLNIKLEKDILSLKNYTLLAQKNRKNAIFNYLQFGYKPDTKERSFGIGVKIPFFAGLTSKQINTQSEIIKSKIRLQTITQQQNIDINNIKEKLVYHFNNIKLFQNKNMKVLYKKYIKSNNIDALTVLDIKENLLIYELYKLENKQSFFIEYINILEKTGRFIDAPFKNQIKG